MRRAGLAIAAAGWAIVCAGLGPRPLAIDASWTGDPLLARQVQRALGPRPGTRAVAVAIVSPGDTRIAALGTTCRPDGRAVDRDSGFEIHMEPGRLLVGNAGVLLTRVTYVKRSGEKRFVICDAAMNDLIRPSLYGAFHRIEPVATRRPGGNGGGSGGQGSAGDAGGPADIVGPVCESGDFLAKDRDLPPVAAGDLLCVRSAGAYGFVMSSNYNARPRAAEVLVDGARFAVVRARETCDDLVRGETAEPGWIP